MIVAASGNRRSESDDEEERVLTEWRDKRVVCVRESGVRTAVVVQERRQGMWIGAARWLVTGTGIRYTSGSVAYRDEWFHDDKQQEKRVHAYADEHTGTVRIERDWRGPPEQDYEQLSDLSWQVGSRWKIDETGAEHIR